MSAEMKRMNEFYHALNRGVDKKVIFPQDKDYFRFVHNLAEFNDKNWVSHSNTRLSHEFIDIESRKKQKELLVELYGFCLMDNHYHLLLSPLEQDAMSTYLHKVNMGFSKYFNTKYDRSGTLFQGRYKSVLIESEKQFSHILLYIHLNPLDYFMPEWRKRSLNGREVDKCLKYLESFRWSSHLDYLGKGRFFGLDQKSHFLNYYNGVDGYLDALVNWLKAPKYGYIKNVTLESVRLPTSNVGRSSEKEKLTKEAKRSII